MWSNTQIAEESQHECQGLRVSCWQELIARTSDIPLFVSALNGILCWMMTPSDCDDDIDDDVDDDDDDDDLDDGDVDDSHVDNRGSWAFQGWHNFLMAKLYTGLPVPFLFQTKRDTVTHCH